MKIALLTLPLLAYVLLASPAHAETPAPFFASNSLEYCQSLASMASATARARGELTATEAYEVIDSTPGPLERAQDMKYVVDYVFAYPHSSPSSEGNMIYDLCRNGD